MHITSLSALLVILGVTALVLLALAFRYLVWRRRVAVGLQKQALQGFEIARHEYEDRMSDLEDDLERYLNNGHLAVYGPGGHGQMTAAVAVARRFHQRGGAVCLIGGMKKVSSLIKAAFPTVEQEIADARAADVAELAVRVAPTLAAGGVVALRTYDFPEAPSGWRTAVSAVSAALQNLPQSQPVLIVVLGAECADAEPEARALITEFIAAARHDLRFFLVANTASWDPTGLSLRNAINISYSV